MIVLLFTLTKNSPFPTPCVALVGTSYPAPLRLVSASFGLHKSSFVTHALAVASLLSAVLLL